MVGIIWLELPDVVVTETGGLQTTRTLPVSQ